MVTSYSWQAQGIMRFQGIMYIQKMKWNHNQFFGRLYTLIMHKKRIKNSFATGGFEPTVAKIFVSSAGYLTHPEKETESKDTGKYNYTFWGRNVKVNELQQQELEAKNITIKTEITKGTFKRQSTHKKQHQQKMLNINVY